MANPIPLVGGDYYHIYNRGNNGETIFRNAENYRYFMQLYTEHVEPAAVTHALCLLPNHFHFLTYIRTDEEQRSWQWAQGCQPSEGWQPSPPHRAFKNLFIAYSLAFNLRYERTGSLFQKPFKRILVDSERYYTALVRYIHRNPERHGLIADFHNWPWSSYRAILSDRPTHLPRADVLARFGGRDSFIAAHQVAPDEQHIASLIAGLE
jgi:REP element-mobilizing transposase RayT